MLKTFSTKQMYPIFSFLMFHPGPLSLYLAKGPLACVISEFNCTLKGWSNMYIYLLHIYGDKNSLNVLVCFLLTVGK